MSPGPKGPVLAPPVYDWSGLYVGANIGGAWSNSTLTDSNIGASWNPDGTGFIGGLQAGYNFQTSNFLYGIEGDFDATTFKGVTAPIATPIGGIQAPANKDGISTFAARFGVAFAIHVSLIVALRKDETELRPDPEHP